MFMRYSSIYSPALSVAVLAGFNPFPASAHNFLEGGRIVNPDRSSADRDNAKLNFLARQARRNGVDEAKVQAARSVFYNGYRWTKSDIKVCFWNGTEAVQREVMDIARVWHDAVPTMNFNFEDSGRVRTCRVEDLTSFAKLSDIRIALVPDSRSLYNPQDISAKSGDWAYPGRSVSQDVKFPTTMNLVGAVRMRDSGRMSDYYFNVRHEFGHALALAHEHQRAVCKGWFNLKEIARDTGWSEALAATQVNAIDESSNAYGFIGAYDRDSIMQYNFAPSWYMPDRPSQPNPCRRREEVVDLSEMDKYVVAALYEPQLNESPERRRLLEKVKAEAAARTTSIGPGAVEKPRSAQAGDIEAALRDYEERVRNTSSIVIQVYPHKVDQAKVLAAISNLGYPLKSEDGHEIRSISANTTAGLREDPTNSLLYTSDVSDQDVRYIALSLVAAGIEVKSIQPYVPHKRNHFAKRKRLVQIGADVTNRNREPLSVEEILDRPLPIFGRINRKP